MKIISNEYDEKVRYLKGYYWIIQNLIDELIRSKEDSYLKASQISGMPKSQIIRTIDDVYQEKIIRIEKLDKKIREYYSRKKEIEQVIDALEDPQQRYVLKNKYMYFKTFEEISINLDKSCKQISRWHSEAINNLKLPSSVNQY